MTKLATKSPDILAMNKSGSIEADRVAIWECLFARCSYVLVSTFKHRVDSDCLEPPTTELWIYNSSKGSTVSSRVK